MKFNTIHAEADIDLIIDQSKSGLQVIFKHSTACPISSIAYERMLAYEHAGLEQVEAYLTKVIEERGISNKLEEKLGIKHESPQIMILQNGHVVYHESHLHIQPSILENYI